MSGSGIEPVDRRKPLAVRSSGWRHVMSPARLLAVGCCAAVVGLGVVARTQHDAASIWKDRTEEARTELGRLQAELADTRKELDETTDADQRRIAQGNVWAEDAEQVLLQYTSCVDFLAGHLRGQIGYSADGVVDACSRARAAWEGLGDRPR